LLKKTEPNPIDFFQVWINLPKKDKFADPHFTMFWGEDVPTITVKDAASNKDTSIRVIAGSPSYFAGLPAKNASGRNVQLAPPPESWAAKDENDVAIWEVYIPAGGRVVIPPARFPDVNRVVYSFEGDVSISDETANAAPVVVKQKFGAKMNPTGSFVLEANSGKMSKILILQGRPIGEPVAQHGPFVMNQHEEVRQAWRDFHETKFGGWPWPDEAPTHGKTRTRFAKHADGRIEEPPKLQK